jgi:hypothetical protein
MRLRIVIDCALYVYLYEKDDEEDEKAICLIELYTEEGAYAH